MIRKKYNYIVIGGVGGLIVGFLINLKFMNPGVPALSILIGLIIGSTVNSFKNNP